VAAAPFPGIPAVLAAAAAGFAILSAAVVALYVRLRRLHRSPGVREAELVDLSERLRRHSEHLRLVIDTVPAYIYAKDDAGHFILANRLFARVFGVEPEEVTGKTNEDYGATPEETARFMEEDREILRTGKPLFVPEERAPRPDGSPGWFQTTKIPYRHPDWEKPAILGVSVDITESKEQAEALRRSARHDPLTGLAYRALFSELLGKALAVTRRERSRLALLFIDLDDFKPVNDNYGHAAGDAVLRETARKIEGALRESDGAGRFGGDEFVAFAFGIARREDAAAVAEKVREAIRMPVDVGASVLCVTASVGYAVFPEDGTDEQSLLKRADAEMYREKQERSGKQRPRP
jgi:diguanylate cyclase (GGDEF)-like protein/PAS domain S-box-containing protein